MKFKIETILTVTHDIVLTSNLHSIYELMKYMTGDDEIYTHTHIRAINFVKTFIISQHPNLEEWPDLHGIIDKTNYEQYVKMAQEMFGEELDLQPSPDGVWSEMDPADEALKYFDKDKIIEIKNEPKSGFEITSN